MKFFYLYPVFLIYYIGHIEGIQLKPCPFDEEMFGITEKLCIPKNYSKITAPTKSVSAIIFIESAPQIQDMRKSIDLNVNFIFQWEENRLHFESDKFEEVTLPDEFARTLWKPYIYVENINKFEILSGLQESISSMFLHSCVFTLIVSLQFCDFVYLDLCNPVSLHSCVLALLWSIFHGHFMVETKLNRKTEPKN